VYGAHLRRKPNKVWTKKNMANPITVGEAIITLNQSNTFTRPESTKKALIDHAAMANKYMLKIFLKRSSGLETITNVKITP
jgi:hypothetical protein